MFPPAVRLLPSLFQNFLQLEIAEHLVPDSFSRYAGLFLPFTVLILASLFATLPVAKLERAARMDGWAFCGYFLTIVLPCPAPACGQNRSDCLHLLLEKRSFRLALGS